jgi:hypothetical protein
MGSEQNRLSLKAQVAMELGRSALMIKLNPARAQLGRDSYSIGDKDRVIKVLFVAQDI